MKRGESLGIKVGLAIGGWLFGRSYFRKLVADQVARETEKAKPAGTWPATPQSGTPEEPQMPFFAGGEAVTYRLIPGGPHDWDRDSWVCTCGAWGLLTGRNAMQDPYAHAKLHGPLF